ncbi:hypothetical protein AAMO2058_000605700 [Amorphochlora amoebiformis]
MPLTRLSREFVADIASRYPRLRDLNLSNNKLQDIENLDLLPWLRHVNLDNNSVTTLRNLSGNSELSSLKIANNRVDHITPELLKNLEVLDLRNNRITDYDQVAGLSPEFCPRLRELSLAGNPIASDISYRHRVSSALSQIAMLDGEKISPSDVGGRKERDSMGAFVDSKVDNRIVELEKRIEEQESELRKLRVEQGPKQDQQAHRTSTTPTPEANATDIDDLRKLNSDLSDQNQTLKSDVETYKQLVKSKEVEACELRGFHDSLNRVKLEDVEIPLKKKCSALEHANAKAQQELKLLRMKIESLEKISEIQDSSALGLPRRTSRNMVEQRLGERIDKWRQKVFHMLMQQKKDAIILEESSAKWKTALENLNQRLMETDAKLSIADSKIKALAADVTLHREREEDLKSKLRMYHSHGLKLNQKNRRSEREIQSCGSLVKILSNSQGCVLRNLERAASTLRGMDDRLKFASDRLATMKTWLALKVKAKRVQESSSVSSKEDELKTPHLRNEVKRLLEDRARLLEIIKESKDNFESLKSAHSEKLRRAEIDHFKEIAGAKDTRKTLEQEIRRLSGHVRTLQDKLVDREQMWILDKKSSIAKIKSHHELEKRKILNATAKKIQEAKEEAESLIDSSERRAKKSVTDLERDLSKEKSSSVILRRQISEQDLEIQRLRLACKNMQTTERSRSEWEVKSLREKLDVQTSYISDLKEERDRLFTRIRQLELSNDHRPRAERRGSKSLEDDLKRLMDLSSRLTESRER